MLYVAQNVEMYPISSAGKETLYDFDDLIECQYEDLRCKALQIIGSKSYLFAGDTSRNAACTLITDTYREAKQKFAQFNPACGSFVKWYGGFMRQVFRRRRQSGGRHQVTLVQTSPVGCDPPNQHPSFEDLDTNLIEREMVDSILSHSDLGPFERTIVDLSYRRDWQGSEIARWFNLSPAYLRTKRQRVLHYLRSIAQEIQQDEEAGELQVLPHSHRTRERHSHHIQKRVAAPGHYAANTTSESLTGEPSGIQPA